jgi:hypothetical protein
MKKEKTVTVLSVDVNETGLLSIVGCSADSLLLPIVIPPCGSHLFLVKKKVNIDKGWCAVCNDLIVSLVRKL